MVGVKSKCLTCGNEVIVPDMKYCWNCGNEIAKSYQVSSIFGMGVGVIRHPVAPKTIRIIFESEEKAGAFVSWLNSDLKIDLLMFYHVTGYENKTIEDVKT